MMTSHNTPAINTLKYGTWYNKHSFKCIAKLTIEKWNSPSAHLEDGLETRAVSSCIDTEATLVSETKDLGFNAKTHRSELLKNVFHKEEN